jgi:hypothetical protein
MKNEHLLNDFMKENNLSYDEPFFVSIDNKTKRYKIVKSTNNYVPEVYVFSSLLNDWTLAVEEALTNILFNNNFKIISAWKPKLNEEYYYFDGKNIYCSRWNNYFTDISSFLTGNCFKSVEEAEANKEKIMKIFNQNQPLINLYEAE